MSLQVWLPLTKNYKNKGIGKYTITNSGSTLYESDFCFGKTVYDKQLSENEAKELYDTEKLKYE